MKKKLITFAAAAGFLLTTFNGNASAHDLTYNVKSGDTLWKIATANGISLSELKDWNNLSTDSILVNQSLSLLPPHTHTNTSTYTVKSGDTLTGIARLSELTEEELKTLNKLRSNLVYSGQVLKIGTSSTPSVSPLAAISAINKVDVETSSSKVDSLVAESKKYIGIPYVWGGTSPSGFDCSGFLNFVFVKVGVSIPRTVATIWKETTTVANPNVGDIVFFETYTSGPSHAGIYLGNNKFIHAGSSTGVTISDLNSSYWKKRYLGARTPL
ncbi:C40 family peptidase [Pseudoneobacillus rhizosphaerae]|uniref:Peptidoglycan endopeptidase LytE n=1 Tax=Pseudoneobacillus rhizosphaerae TaxID=2880968 RepID=A0A9C7G6J7_9BACI|nr:C40 family peptidase [Pseudoneobacillus rhizosphaerae]CAG9606472.1 putative peptidoglycan endopeptidase LytE [Pseudoneobacillus rhizosphaerae]